MTQTLEYRSGTYWFAVPPEREAEFVAEALAEFARAPQFYAPAHYTTEAELRAALAGGRTVQYDQRWDATLRDAGAAANAAQAWRARRAAAARTAPRQYTCPACGDHRDTTFAGHCDDCEA
jgi:hypothetical protein